MQVHKEWITPETWKLIDERTTKYVKHTLREIKKRKLRTKYTEYNKKVKTATRMNKRDFIAREAESTALNQRIG